MVTTADTISLQQQLRREITDAVAQIRNEKRNEHNGRLDLQNNASMLGWSIVRHGTFRRFEEEFAVRLR